MSGNPAASGLRAIGRGVQRLNDTEISLSSVLDAVAGWWRQIAKSAAALLNALLPRFLLDDDLHLRIAIAGPGHAHFAVRRNNTVLSETQIEIDRSSGLHLPPGSGSSAVICISEGAALFKRIPISTSVRGQKLFRALDYMLEVESPFRRDQVLWAYRCPADQRHAQRLIELVIIPRAIVDPLIGQLESKGIHVREIQYRTSLAGDDVIRVAAYRTPAMRRWRRLCQALGVLAFLEILALMGLPFIANEVQSERLSTKIEQLSRTASELAGMRSEIERPLKPISAAIGELQALPSPTAVLLILQKDLGPDVVLDRLSMRGRIIQVSGTAPSLPEVVDHLERSPHLKPRSITTNGTAGPQRHERFTLSLELERAP